MSKVIWRGYMSLWDRLIGRKTIVVEDNQEEGSVENAEPSLGLRNEEFRKAEEEEFARIRRELGK